MWIHTKGLSVRASEINAIKLRELASHKGYEIQISTTDGKPHGGSNISNQATAETEFDKIRKTLDDASSPGFAATSL